MVIQITIIIIIIIVVIVIIIIINVIIIFISHHYHLQEQQPSSNRFPLGLPSAPWAWVSPASFTSVRLLGPSSAGILYELASVYGCWCWKDLNRRRWWNPIRNCREIINEPGSMMRGSIGIDNCSLLGCLSPFRPRVVFKRGVELNDGFFHYVLSIDQETEESRLVCQMRCDAMWMDLMWCGKMCC